MSSESQSPVRPYVTLFVIAVVIAGFGGVIAYEALTEPEITLSDSQAFNVFLGAILGYAGAVIAFLYPTRANN